MNGLLNFGLIDTQAPGRIAGSVMQGYDNALARMMQQRQNENQNKLADLQLRNTQLGIAQTERQMADDQAWKDSLRGVTGDVEQAIPSLMKVNPEKALKLQQTMQEGRSRQISMAKDKLGILRTLSSRVFANPTLQNAMSAVQEYGRMTGDDVTAMVQQLQQIGENPVELRRLAGSNALDADKMLAKFQSVDVGGQVSMGTVDPISGEFTAKTAVPKTMPPEAVAADRRALVDQSIKRQDVATKEEANRVTRDIAGLKRIQDVEMKIADDYRAESKGFAETSTAMKKVLAALQTADNNPGSALSAGTAFMKILDPNSVVRETELGMALNASGWFDRASNIVNQLKSGRNIMTQQQVKNLTAAATDLFNEAKKAQQEVDAAYMQRAKSYGADPRNIITDRGQNAIGAPANTQATDQPPAGAVRRVR